MNEMGDDLIDDKDLLDEPETEPSSSTDNVSEEIASSVLSHLGEQVNNPTLETFDPIILSLPDE